ncbi:MAG TPA: o-succinylbenzoate synthase [Cyclobacteriaceae bacterium]|nr:o-succinylbenzoate synthase [Cyclobacteriaceae bacterium]
MKEKTSWFIKVWEAADESKYGIGECGPLPGLSMDDLPTLENILRDVIIRLGAVHDIHQENIFAIVSEIVPRGFPAVVFALETALLDLSNGGKRIVFDNGFVKGEPIPINGLVWMGDEEFMMKQVHEKISEGFQCIKLKVGAIDFDRECRILESIRKTYEPAHITLRLDANGAFSAEDALAKLKALSRFDIHSIEQPIKPGRDAMEKICSESPIPIALDEELIGREGNKDALLKKIHPQFIILKPTIHGGFNHCRLWIEEAVKMNIGWWITSALESNVGLNAICQFTANYHVDIPQGLGTGSIYTNNIPSPLSVERGFIRSHAIQNWPEL